LRAQEGQGPFGAYRCAVQYDGCAWYYRAAWSVRSI